MKNKSTKILLPLLVFAVLLPLTGCVSAGYQGLVPGKDVHLKNFRQEITTPWGHTTITADELDTIVRSDAKGALTTSYPLNVTPAVEHVGDVVAK